MVIPPNEPETAQHSAIRVFSIGHEGKRPSVSVVSMADRIAKAAVDKAVEPEITVDADGALSFDLRLASGRLVLAELDLDGAPVGRQRHTLLGAHFDAELDSLSYVR